MTKPRHHSADDSPNQSEEEAAAARVQTITADQNGTDGREQATALVEGVTESPQNGEDPTDTSRGDSAADDNSEHLKPAKAKTRINRSRALAFAVLPSLALLLTAAGGLLKWQESLARASAIARIESVAAATDSTVALLSYQPDTVENDLENARGGLTGTFQQSYTELTHDVVIPGAKQQHIGARATVPAAASVSATSNHAVVLVFVNQTTTVGTAPPTDTTSSVKVTLEKADGRWLISAFDPV